jgi:hypothetical protein
MRTSIEAGIPAHESFGTVGTVHNRRRFAGAQAELTSDFGSSAGDTVAALGAQSDNVVYAGGRQRQRCGALGRVHE